MAKPIPFEGQNGVYRGAPDSGVEDLPVLIRGCQVTSVWHFSPEELERVLATGCVEINILGPQPPMSVTAPLSLKSVEIPEEHAARFRMLRRDPASPEIQMALHVERCRRREVGEPYDTDSLCVWLLTRILRDEF